MALHHIHYKSLSTQGMLLSWTTNNSRSISLGKKGPRMKMEPYVQKKAQLA